MIDPVYQKILTATMSTNEAERLAALHRYKILDTPPEVAFDRITKLAARLFDMPIALISLLDESRAWFKSCVGFDANEVPLDATFCNFAVSTDEPLIVPDARLDERFVCNPFVQAEPGVRFYAGAPLLSRDGFNLGTLCILDRQPRNPLTPEQQATLVDLAAMVVDELELRLAAHQSAWSEEKYRTLFESIDEGFCTIEVLFAADGKPFDHRILQANSAFEWQSGIANPEGKTASELVPGLEQYWNNLYAQVINTGESTRAEVRSDALDRWFDILVSRVGDAAMRQVAVVFTDISKRKQAEAILQQTSAELESQVRKFDATLSTITDSVFSFDRDGRFLYANQVLLDVWGISAAEAIGKTMAELKYPATVERQVLDDLQQVLETGKSVRNETPYSSPTGVEGYFEYILSPVIAADRTIDSVVGCSRDISDRKRVEDERKNVEAALRESETRLRFMLNASQIGDWDLDLTTEPHTAHRSFRHDQIFGYESLLPEWSYDIFLAHVHPDDRAAVNEKFQETLSASTNWNFECRIIHPDQSIHWIWVRSSVYCDASGTPIRLLGMVVDITEAKRDEVIRKQAEAERERLLQQEKAAREEAQRANQIKDEFLAVLSHELRSPLNPILGWTRLLRNGKLDPARQKDALATIERNAKLQSQLIEDLLDISRIMQGKLTLTATSVSLAFVIAAAVETVNLAADAKNIQITLDLDPDVAPVSGDAARLQQVVWNLLTNAVKFTDSGGQVLVELRRVATEGGLGNAMAQIRVIDTGKGIRPQFLPHVFEYFRQEDGSTTRRFGGLGLGLAIVRQIVELHGGTVKAESAGEHQGATFIVQLPTLQASLIDFEPTQAQATSETRLQNVKILLVDDDADTREFETFLLEQQGATVIAAASGSEALQALDRSLPDVIVSDIGMAEIDGYALMQQIRLRPSAQGGTIPAIALTAYAGDLNQQQALKAGFQQHLSKPVEPEVLVKTIAALVQKDGNE